MTRLLKAIAREIPGLAFLYHKCVALALRGRSAEDVFTDIFNGNKWGGRESTSGLGSDAEQTRVVMRELPVMFRDFDIRSILDIPCGDFNWMRQVDMEGIDYIGADVVAELINRNHAAWEAERRQFRRLNVLNDPLPAVDLIFCRDCLVHFSYRDIISALKNIIASRSTFLLTTTFTARTRNCDIATGQWRPLNLQLPPITFPRPIRVINEACGEDGGEYRDKSLALWRIADIAGAVLSKYRW